MKEHEKIRRRFWSKVWCRVAGSEGINTTQQATSWADLALEDFDKRFPEEREEENGTGTEESCSNSP